MIIKEYFQNDVSEYEKFRKCGTIVEERSAYTESLISSGKDPNSVEMTHDLQKKYGGRENELCNSNNLRYIDDIIVIYFGVQDEGEITYILNANDGSLVERQVFNITECN